MSEADARAHVARFNAAVRSGDWSGFVAALHPDAVMSFVGPPVGPFQGRKSIEAAYAVSPPDDTIEIREVNAGVVAFTWSRGGTGTLTLGWRDGQVAEMIIRFD